MMTGGFLMITRLYGHRWVEAIAPSLHEDEEKDWFYPILLAFTTTSHGSTNRRHGRLTSSARKEEDDEPPPARWKMRLYVGLLVRW